MTALEDIAHHMALSRHEAVIAMNGLKNLGLPHFEALANAITVFSEAELEFRRDLNLPIPDGPFDHAAAILPVSDPNAETLKR